MTQASNMILPSVRDIHTCTLDGTDYGFRTPTPYDVPTLRRTLGRQGLRRPLTDEFRVCGVAGIAALGERAGDPEEAERQTDVFESWYKLLVPHKEDELDEPDLEERAVQLAELERARQAKLEELLPEIAAIEAMLTRHWPPYAELLADRHYYDEISEIDVVRLLLVRIGDLAVLPDREGLLPGDRYRQIPSLHRRALAQFATGLLTQDETATKN
jgi:hypothetical protein